MSINDPQWLCDCNTSGEETTLERAAETAGRHFLGGMNAGTPHGTVAVYRKRGDYAYSISTLEQAEKAAYPWRTVTTTLTASSGGFIEALGRLAENTRSATQATEGLTIAKMDALIESIEADAYYKDKLEGGAAIETITINPLTGPPKAYRLTEADYRKSGMIEGYAEPVILEDPNSGSPGSRFKEAQRQMLGYFEETMWQKQTPPRRVEG